jgi:hypothetical protein
MNKANIEIVKVWNNALLLKQGKQHYFWKINGEIIVLGRKTTIENNRLCRHDSFFFPKDLELIQGKAKELYEAGICCGEKYSEEEILFGNFDYME